MPYESIFSGRSCDGKKSFFEQDLGKKLISFKSFTSEIAKMYPIIATSGANIAGKSYRNMKSFQIGM